MNNRGWAWSKGEETGISPGRVYILIFSELIFSRRFSRVKQELVRMVTGDPRLSRQRTRLPLVMIMGKQELSDGWQVNNDGSL